MRYYRLTVTAEPVQLHPEHWCSLSSYQTQFSSWSNVFHSSWLARKGCRM